MAAISHFFGLLPALIVWATQKDKSRFVRFQAMKAVVFDAIVSAAMFLVGGYLMAIAVGMLALGVGDIAIFGSASNPLAQPIRSVVALMDAVPLLIGVVLILLAGTFFIIRLIASIESLQGKNFRYPLVGHLVERYQVN